MGMSTDYSYTKPIGRRRNRTKTQYALFGLIIACCLGEVITLYGLKLSWLMTFITIYFFIIDHFKKKYIVSTKDLRYYITFFILWVFYAFFQLLFIYRNSYAVSGFFSLVINVFIILMMVLSIHNLEDLVFINKALIFGLAINLLIALWEIYTGNHIVKLVEVNELYYFHRPVSIYGNGNDLATFICLGFTAVILDYVITKRNKIVTLLLLSVSLFVLAKIDARAPIFGIIFYLVLIILNYFLLKLYKKNKIVFFISILLLAAAFSITAILMFTNYTADELVLLLSSPGNQSSDLQRLNLIRGALRGFVDTNLLGVGSGQSIVLLGTNVHNFLVEIMCEYGIFVLIGIIAIFAFFIMSFKWKLPALPAVCAASFPPAFLIIGISSSGANRIRATWILITAIFIMVSFYKNNPMKINERYHNEKNIDNHGESFS